MIQTRQIGAAIVVSLSLPRLTLSATLNVPADYSTIQACIHAAVDAVDECVVAPGTYLETINFLGKAITLRSSGGKDVTTIDATGLAASVVTCASGEGPDTVLEGFTITGGTGTAVGGRRYGGGMFNVSSSPTVTNCKFSGNRANFYGGGMYNMANSNTTVTNCSFIGNSAWQGGAMYNDVSSPTVTYCAFVANEVGAGGGGLFNLFGTPTVTHCTFSGNIVGYSGGGIYNQYSNPEVTNCTFSGNTAKYGGGMYNDNSNPAVADCLFSGNRTSYGGGMFNVSGAPTTANCTFIANSAAAFGGAMYNQGGNPRTTDCTFIANTAGSGGAMINLGGSPFVTNCTFTGNTSTADGGGMFNLDSSPVVANCIFWGDSPSEIVNTDLSLPTMAFNDVQGGLPVGVVDGGRNIDLDPTFVRSPDPGPDGMWDGVDDDYGDLRLSPGSPCINAGDPAFVPQPGETDLDGHARVLCARVDTGAYEFGIGDYNCDQTVNFSDFGSWSFCMTEPNPSPNPDTPTPAPCDAFDFNADGDVDLLDFAEFSLTLTPQ